ncbi:MarR family transcriptional regulator [Streptomyces coffeae]|uniref:MarR family transcriptional regulator n=1 Tax=Streptomyces coffeae TaxID=621382 RepID=A0ABS1NEZ1_9ACTN|nr:MarR family transcriptional regulator [Streptomyces coffeae]
MRLAIFIAFCLRADYGALNALLSAGEPYELRPMDLRERLLLTSGGTSNVLNRLVKAGLLTRQQDASDGRSSPVSPERHRAALGRGGRRVVDSGPARLLPGCAG